MNDFTTITVETDLLILGGGMAACGAAAGDRGRSLAHPGRVFGPGRRDTLGAARSYARVTISRSTGI